MRRKKDNVLGHRRSVVAQWENNEFCVGGSASYTELYLWLAVRPRKNCFPSLGLL